MLTRVDILEDGCIYIQTDNKMGVVCTLNDSVDTLWRVASVPTYKRFCNQILRMLKEYDCATIGDLTPYQVSRFCDICIEYNELYLYTSKGQDDSERPLHSHNHETIASLIEAFS